jgi:hypothetical protein
MRKLRLREGTGSGVHNLIAQKAAPVSTTYFYYLFPPPVPTPAMVSGMSAEWSDSKP